MSPDIACEIAPFIDSKTGKLSLFDSARWGVENFGTVDRMIAALLPHVVKWPLNQEPPWSWLSDNITEGECWVPFVDGMHFSRMEDGFAFKMRWG